MGRVSLCYSTVTAINVLFSVFAVLLVPLEQLSSVDDPLAFLANSVVGPGFADVVRFDAALVLAGSVLTGYVGVAGLVERMAADKCLPEVFADTGGCRAWLRRKCGRAGGGGRGGGEEGEMERLGGTEGTGAGLGGTETRIHHPVDEDRLARDDEESVVAPPTTILPQRAAANSSSRSKESFRGPPWAAILLFLAVCSWTCYALDTDIELLTNLYSLSFLLVMALFAAAGLWMKYSRPSLPRPFIAPTYHFVVGFLCVMLAFLGATLKHQQVLAYFILFYLFTVALVMITYYRAFLITSAAVFFDSLGFPSRFTDVWVRQYVRAR